MGGRETTQAVDILLLPFLRATEAAESVQLLEQLVCEHADSSIRQVLRHKLRGFVNSNGRSLQAQGQDVEDVYSEARLQLLARLSELKTDPSARPIGDFRSYVAVLTYNACHEYLRKKYPKRHSLKNQIRYRLEHTPSLACWEGRGAEWLCGFAVWRDRERAERRWDDQLESSFHDAWKHVHTYRLNDAELLAAIFKQVGGPVELDDLVNVCAMLRGINDATVSIGTTETGPSDLPQRARDPIDVELARRSYLQQLWAEIRQLLPRQRVALLLNLRDANGNSAIDLFVLTGIATLRQIADVLGMPAGRFAELWNDLPLSDARIAEDLGVTRQQVINLRKSARERLARRMLNQGVRPSGNIRPASSPS